jgi:hypothetical protein
VTDLNFSVQFADSLGDILNSSLSSTRLGCLVGHDHFWLKAFQRFSRAPTLVAGRTVHLAGVQIRQLL